MSIKIKFITKANTYQNGFDFSHMFPKKEPILDSCSFSFNADDTDYDWVVVYEDLPPNQQKKECPLKVSCDPRKTLLITTEPYGVKFYPKEYTQQFFHVITSHRKNELYHKNATLMQSGLIWFYSKKGVKSEFDYLSTMPVPEKNNTISVVCSSKKNSRTLHSRRLSFVEKLKQKISLIDHFGHGVRGVSEKHLALDSYKYHISIENYVAEHYWSEKISDAFLGYSLPFYYGCPNIGDYFPEDSYIEIDIFDVEKSCEIICSAIKGNLWEKRIETIIEARKLYLNNYSLFNNISAFVTKADQCLIGDEHSEFDLYSRQSVRSLNFRYLISHLNQSFWHHMNKRQLINGLGL